MRGLISNVVIVLVLGLVVYAICFKPKVDAAFAEKYPLAQVAESSVQYSSIV